MSDRSRQEHARQQLVEDDVLGCAAGMHVIKEYFEFHRCVLCGNVDWKKNLEVFATPKDPQQQIYMVKKNFARWDETPGPEPLPEPVLSDADQLHARVRYLRQEIHTLTARILDQCYTPAEVGNQILMTAERLDLAKQLKAILNTTKE